MFPYEVHTMSKKKKETRKYTPKNEFRRNTSKSAVGHFDYVFGETQTHYKSLGLTHTPDNKYPYYPLKENPNPTDSKQSFLRLNVRSTNKKYLPKKEEDWKFSKEDMPVVRHMIKKYKKSTNRQPKDWYKPANLHSSMQLPNQHYQVFYPQYPAISFEHLHHNWH